MRSILQHCRVPSLFLIPLLGGIMLLPPGGAPTMAKPGDKSTPSNGRVAAIVNGKPLYLESLNSPDIAKTRRQLYGLERRMLQKVVLEKLRKERPREFNTGKINFTEAEIAKVYKEAGLSSRGTLDSFRDRIRDYLIREKTKVMEEELFAKATRLGYVTPRLESPPPYLYRLKRVNRKPSTLGPHDAKVTVVEFSDFQ